MYSAFKARLRAFSNKVKVEKRGLPRTFRMEAIGDSGPVPSAAETRPLASIVHIKDLIPITGADRICIAKIKGWQCIVAINEFKVGDLAIYFSIDSVLDRTDPNIPQPVMRRGGNIKTIKLKGVVSQGLLSPLGWLTARGHDISVGTT